MAIRKYDKVYVPGSHERPNFSIDDFKNGSKTHVDELSDIIVMSEEDLLDLMQEAMEHTIPAQLPRDNAKALLISRIKH